MHLPVSISPEEVADDLLRLLEIDPIKAFEIREQQREFENQFKPLK